MTPDGGTGGLGAPDARDGASGSDAQCDTDRLWSLVADAALGMQRLGYCFAWPMGTAGSVVLDEAGRVIDNTGSVYLSTGSKQEWLSAVANDRWPCLAGQSVRYQCSAE